MAKNSSWLEENSRLLDCCGNTSRHRLERCACQASIQAGNEGRDVYNLIIVDISYNLHCNFTVLTDYVDVYIFKHHNASLSTINLEELDIEYCLFSICTCFNCIDRWSPRRP